MEKFNEHQSRLWKGMLQSIDNYDEGKCGFSKLVGELEGAFDAGDFREPGISLRWYDLWTPLEIARATSGDQTEKSNVDKYLLDMKEFLQNILVLVQK